MPVVSDTSPILNLAIIGRLSLLQDQFTEVYIPTAVLRELRIEEDMPGSQAIKTAVGAGWIRVAEAQDAPLVTVLKRELDIGEAEAIALSVQMKAGLVLLDEREGRAIARALGLKVTGVLGIALKAYRQGQLPSLQQVMEELREKAGFRIAPELFAELMREAGRGRTGA